MAGVLPQNATGTPQGVIQVIPPGALDRMEALANKQKAEAEDAATAALSEPARTNLAGYIRTQFEMMRNHRDNTTSGWSTRLISALRAFNGLEMPRRFELAARRLSAGRSAVGPRPRAGPGDPRKRHGRDREPDPV